MVEFLGTNQMYVVLLIVLLVWGGIVWYLTRLDKKIKELEKAIKRG